MGDKNIMRNPEIAKKLSGKNHWTAKHKKSECVHCGILCSKTNYTKWHGDKCRKKIL